MQIQPRQQLLDIWRYTVKASYRDGQWRPGGSNSITEAEQLLCLLAPATRLKQFELSRPDSVSPDIAAALRGLGDVVRLPQRLVTILGDYIDRYTEAGTPVFPGGDYFHSSDHSHEPTDEQKSWDVVASFAVSVTLMLAIIEFAQDYRRVAPHGVVEKLIELETKASTRLTAAMVGLLRSFAVNVFPVESDMGERLMRTVHQGRQLPDQVVGGLHEKLKEVIAGLRDDLTIGTGADKAQELEDPGWLFECGWSWGVVRGASSVDTTADIGLQSDGTAENAPYLYFTTVAMDAAEALAEERTRLPGWLSPEQLRLAQQLQARAELVRTYWANVATFETGSSWPIEDLPWQTTDGRETDYYSLLVAGLLVSQMTADSTSEAALDRVLSVVERLAERSRITARVTEADSSGVAIHRPFFDFPLVGSAVGGPPELACTFVDMAPVLLRRTLELAAMMPGGPMRRRADRLADRIWDHLVQRRISATIGEGLWDQPAGVFSRSDNTDGSLSWAYTRRVVDCQIAAARKIEKPPKPPVDLTSHATHLLDQAEQMLDLELLRSDAKAGDQARTALDRCGAELRLARQNLANRPAVTEALVQSVLRELGLLDAARRAVP